jgi:2-methylcitrate dehydratase PrpD
MGEEEREMGQETISQVLGDFAYHLSFKDLPAEVVEKAQISVADALTCAFAGRDLPSSKIALDMWGKIKKAGRSTLWVTGEEGDAENTSWANCLLVSYGWLGIRCKICNGPFPILPQRPGSKTK